MKEIIVNVKEPVRVNKFLGQSGIVSRRNADQIIKDKKVFINGKLATLGEKVKNKDVITLKIAETKLIYALYHKPRGDVTDKITELADCVPVGRLDKESEGLLFYTNDYRLIDALLNPKNKIEKEYEIRVREKATERVERILLNGINTQEASYAPVKKVHISNEGHSINIILTEGKKHEIRRMLNALYLTVMSLRRIRIMNFALRGIAPGKIHHLNERQISVLLKNLKLDKKAELS